MSAEKTFIYSSPVFAVLNDHEFELTQPFVFEWWENETHHRITIPTGFPTDGASVPRFCWSLTGLVPTGVHLGAATVHDYIYERRGLIPGSVLCIVNEDGTTKPEPVKWDRKQADDMFLMIMNAAGETSWKAKVMWGAVRVFGQLAWDN